MQESRKIFVVGKKPTKLFILINAMIPLIISIVLSNVYVKYLNLSCYAIILTIITFLLLLLFYIPIIMSGKNYWNISEQHLEYYPIIDYFQQLKYVVSLFNGKEDMFAFKIKLTEIKSIRLNWKTFRADYLSNPIRIYSFCITLKDSSVITFQSSFNISDKEYLNALSYLKNKFNIQIEDEYNVIKTLEGKNITLNDYIDEIEEKRSQWGQEDD